jgi:hypothetical protein
MFFFLEKKRKKVWNDRKKKTKCAVRYQVLDDDQVLH